MRKKVALIPNVGKEYSSKPRREAEEERKKQQDAKSEYLGTLADKVFGDIEEIFGKTTPPPTGNDMIDVLALVPVFVFARQIRMACKDKKTMKSVMKSTMWALTNQIVEYAAPFLNDEKPWDDIAAEEGGEDGRTES